MIVKETKKKLKFADEQQKLLNQYRDGHISFEDMVKHLFKNSLLLIEQDYEL